MFLNVKEYKKASKKKLQIDKASEQKRIFALFKEIFKLMKAIAEMKPDTEQMMRLEQLCKAGFECEFNSWPAECI